MKKLLALLLSLAALLAALVLLVACGTEEPLEIQNEEEALQFTFFNPGDLTVTIRETQPDPTDPPRTTTPPQSTGGTSGPKVVNSRKLSNKDMRYVLVYNPTVFDEDSLIDNENFNPGTFGSQIDVGMNRSDGLDREYLYWPVAQNEIPSIPMDEVDLSGSKAPGIGKTYRVGDTQKFYAHATGELSDARQQVNFRCQYAGTNCYIWTYNSNMDDATVQNLGKEFDTNIYGAVTTAFGKPRYANDKVNIMIYPLRQGLMGFFSWRDIYTSSELASAQIREYGANTNINMIHINSLYAQQQDCSSTVYGTLAHEFQHLICASDSFERPDYEECGTWLNEAMSGYIEELLYPGTKEADGHLYAYEASYLTRWGWSLYDFTTNSTDLGAYGSVYLFSEYVADLAGENVFSKVHSYWRTSYGTEITEAAALKNAMPASVRQKIDKSITYPSAIKFRNKDEEWMSKLTLDFYLTLLRADNTGPAVFQKINRQALLYDGSFAGNIFGGGRLILALSGDTFTVPADADKGLIYVGLDENFAVVTEFIY